jgi:hypothetical protein
VVLDAVGGPVFAPSLKSLGLDGRQVVIAECSRDAEPKASSCWIRATGGLHLCKPAIHEQFRSRHVAAVVGGEKHYLSFAKNLISTRLTVPCSDDRPTNAKRLGDNGSEAGQPAADPPRKEASARWGAVQAEPK